MDFIKYFYLIASFKICPQILATVNMVLPWSKDTNYACTHEYFHDALSKYSLSTNTESSTYCSLGELALSSVLKSCKVSVWFGCPVWNLTEIFAEIQCLFHLNTFQMCPALCCSLDNSGAPEALQSWSQVSSSWYAPVTTANGEGFNLGDVCPEPCRKPRSKWPGITTCFAHMQFTTQDQANWGSPANCLVASTALLHSQTASHWQQTVYDYRNNLKKKNP